MTISNPNILYFLLAIILVVLIHLLNLQKFKSFYFSNFRLLAEVFKEKRKRSKLNNFILMILRSLIIGAIVLGFSQFFFGDKPVSNDHKHVSLYVDNSLSSSRKIGEPQIFDLQKKYAQDLINSFGDNTSFHIISNDFFSGKHARFIDKKAALDKVKTLELSNYTKNSDFILNKIKQTGKSVSEPINHEIYFMSDFQKNQHDLKDFNSDSISTYLLPFQSKQNNNISLENVKSLSPFYIEGQPITFEVTLKNYNNEAFKSLPLKLYVGKKQKVVNSIDLEPLEQKTVEISFLLKKNESSNILIKIEDNSFEYDNSFYTSIAINKVLNITYIHGDKPTDAYKNLFNSETFNYTSLKESGYNYGDLSNQQLIVLDGLTQWSTGLAQRIKTALQSGANLVVIPNTKTDKLNSFLTAIGLSNSGLIKNTIPSNRFEANLKHPIFKEMFKKEDKNIDQLSSQGSFSPKFSQNNEKVIIKSITGKPFLTSQKMESGSVYLYYADLKNSTNFYNHQLFAPMGINMAYLNDFSKSNNLIIGDFDRIPLPSYIEDKTVKVKYQDAEITPNIVHFKQSKYISIDDQFNTIGFINLVNNQNTIATYGLNQNRIESNMNFENLDDLKTKAEKVEYIHFLDTKKSEWNSFLDIQKTDRLDWIYFLYAALFFYVLEMLFILFINKKTPHETAH